MDVSRILKFLTSPMNSLVVALAIFLMAIPACGRDGTDTRLVAAERIMESRPDSALSILNSIAPSDLSGENNKAFYALLKSMALDKNMIDTTDFSVLQPAIDYYLKNGSPEKKLKTYYYQGRIFMNQGDLDKALDCFARSLDNADECSDSLAVARAFVAQGWTYYAFYDFQGYTESYLKAAEIYRSRRLQNQELDCLLNALNGMILLKRGQEAHDIVNRLHEFTSLDTGQHRLLQGYLLSYILKFGSTDKLKDFIESNDKIYDFDANGILNLARGHYLLGNDAKALQLLQYLDQAKYKYDTLKYLAISFDIMDHIKDYEKALSTYKEFSRRLEIQNADKFKQKSKSFEEKHQIELLAQEDANMRTKTILKLYAGLIILLMGLSVVTLMMRNHKIRSHLASEKARTTQLENEILKAESEALALENRNLQLEKDNKTLEAENLTNRVEKLQDECNELKALLETHIEMPDEVRKTIKKRIEMLNAYLASQISDHKEFESSYEKWVKELTDDTDEFMNSNRLAFQASHPEFIRYFEDHGLTVREINYVCLYAIGLRGKDIGNYMKMRSHVNISSVIREKLGMDKHATNLGIHVRNMLKNL